MIPATLLGLVVFLAVLGPGYVWVRYAETRSPRPQRSGVLEAADVIFIGAFATTLSLVVLFAAGPPLAGFPSLSDVAEDVPGFLRTRPYEAVAGAGFAIALSVSGTLFVAWVRYRHREKSIRPGSTVWHDVFGRAGADRLVSVSVELSDGRFVEGLFLSHVMDPDAEEKDLALQAPLHMWTAPEQGTPRQRLVLAAQRVIIPGTQIRTVWVQYLWD